MNILFVNYGDFTTNSLNHIGGFANTLCATGHACVVAVPQAKETITHISAARFFPATYEEVLAKPGLFPDGQPADIIHAWTPREGVRKFVVAYQRVAPARLIVHLEDNEEFLIEAFGKRPFAELRTLLEHELPFPMVDGIAHPTRFHHLLRLADAVTYIVEPLKKFVPPGTPGHLLEPGVDAALYHPQPPDPAQRRELGLRDDERVVTYTGSVTFANEAEMRELYAAIKLLNDRGTPTRLLRTGFTLPDFGKSLGFDPAPFVIELGFIDKARLPRLLALADVLVQPGHSGFFNDYRLPSKLPEFLAMGQPVILPLSNVGTRLTDVHDAILLRSGSPEEIADACQRIFADPGLAVTLGQNAAAFARAHFDLATNTAGLASLYTSVAAAPLTPEWRASREAYEGEIPLLLRLVRRRVETALQLSSPDRDTRWREVLASLDDLALASRETDYDLFNRERQIGALQKHAAGLEETRAVLQHDILIVREHATAHARELEALNEKEHKSHAETRQELHQIHQRLHAEQLKQAATEQELRATEQELRAAEETLQAVGDKLTATEQELFRIAAARRLAVSEIAALRATAVRQLARTLELCEFTERETLRLQELQTQLHDRDLKIRRMQDSASWKLTAWLRALRRHLLDPYFPKAPAPPAPVLPIAPHPVAADFSPPVAPKFHCSLDAPRNWSPGPDQTLRGWVVLDAPLALREVRARVGDRIYPGTYGFARPDVGQEFSALPFAALSGFRLGVTIEEGDDQVVLEVADETGVWHVFFRHSFRDASPQANRGTYAHWIREFDTLTVAQCEALRATATALSRQPLISILMPVYDTPERWLTKSIESVRAQAYPNWELCIADDASPRAHVRPLLEQFAREDPRIKVVLRPKNGHIAATSNSALELVTGEFTALLDHDDELPPHALLCIAETLLAHADAEVIYSDEDKIDESGFRFDPHFKPDWNPDLLTSQNYFSHLTAYRTATLRAVGGFRIGFEGSQDWDLALRVVERIQPAQIHHIPRILYHWRAVEGSTAMHLQEKDYATLAARKALEEHFSRVGEKATLRLVRGGHWHVQRPRPEPAPLVTLVIPTRNRRELLIPCVESILAKTAYPNFEILIADNDSDDPELLAFYDRMTAKGRLTVLPCPGPFNFSAINNRAVQHARGEILGLLNNDLEVMHPEWLDEMISHAVRPSIGCVGAKLYYPDFRLQHAGVITGLGGVAGHAFKNFSRDEPGTPQFRPHLVHNVSAVTAACLVIRKTVFVQAGGFEEHGLKVAFNDVDFCLRVEALGYHNVFTPFAELLHHESASRGLENTPGKIRRFQSEIEFIKARWGDRLLSDPAYNPNLTLDSEDFALAYPPRVPPLAQSGSIRHLVSLAQIE